MGINMGVSSAVGTYLPLGGGTLTGNFTIGDDLLLRLGTTLDQVFLNRSTTLNANTAVTNVLVGTPVTPALTANSLIISNITTDGDILIAASDGGHSRTALYFDASTPDTYLYNVGGTWTAGATTWTIPAVTLAGTITGGSQVINSIGHIGLGTAAVTDMGLSLAETYTITDNEFYYGLHSNSQGQKTTAAFSGRSIGLRSLVYVGATNTQNWTDSLGLISIWAYNVGAAGATGTVTGFVSILAQHNVGNLTVTNSYGLYVMDSAGDGTLTNQYGIYIANMTKGATLNYCIYAVGGTAYFGGTMQFGTYASGAATDSTGYITINDAAGNARKIMVQA